VLPPCRRAAPRELMMGMRRTLRLAIAGSLGATVALGVQGGGLHGRDGGIARPLSFASSIAYSLARPGVSAAMLAPFPAEPSAVATPGAVPTARIIDGKAIAATVRQEIKAATDELKAAHSVTPGLAVVLVGNRTDSATYVRMKKKAAAEVGFYSVDRSFDDTVSQDELLRCVAELNKDPQVHGILVQLPLPRHIDEAKVLESILVAKDVDGFSAENIGRMCLRGGQPPLALPCTPAGCVELLQRSGVEVAGKEVVVLGRSNIVGMPVAHLLQSMDATVTVCHSRTADLPSHCRRADIIIAAIGRAEMVQADWIKPGATVIDVGVNSKPAPDDKRGYKLCGDVDFDRAKTVAGAITPVPGGVGPMTIAMLLKNTLNLTRASLGLPRIPLRRANTASQGGSGTGP